MERAVPVVRVSEAASAQEFYCNRLGFRIESSFSPAKGAADPRYITLIRGEARIHLSSFAGDGEPGKSVVYIYVDDVEAIHTGLSTKD